jgi:hypothetical protein
MELLTRQGQEGTRPFGLTFTIPGVPALSAPESIAVWKDFCREMPRREVYLIWRMEIQERGALHFHGVAWASDLLQLKPWSRKDKQEVQTVAALQLLWLRALEKAPPVDRRGDPYFGPNGKWQNGVEYCKRNQWPGAFKHSFDCSDGTGATGKWLRYLQDHATKRKQGQVPDTEGFKHWGLVGKKFSRKVGPDEISELTDPQFKLVVRTMQRMGTPQIKCPLAPFGKKLGYTLRRGGHGTSTWFCNPEIIKRIVEWAIREKPE